MKPNQIVPNFPYIRLECEVGRERWRVSGEDEVFTFELFFMKRSLNPIVASLNIAS